MATLNVSEERYIEQVEALVVELFRGFADEADKTRLFLALNDHLKKARQERLLSYEAEIHNAFAIFRLLNGEKLESLFWSLNDAYDCAKRANNIPLEIKILNNLGACWSGEFYLKEAQECFDEVICLNQLVNPPSLGAIFAYSNRISLLMLVWNWEQAERDIAAAREITKGVSVTQATRNDYARGLYNIHVNEAFVCLATKQHARAFAALKLAHEIAKDIEDMSLDEYSARLDAFYTLIVEGNKPAFEAWMQKRRTTSNFVFGVITRIAEVVVLIAAGEHQYVPEMVKMALEAAPQTSRARLQDYFKGLGL